MTNSNFVCDFFRFREAAYYGVMTKYLRHHGVDCPDYELQYRRVLEWLRTTKPLHRYDRFQVESYMSSTLNTKSLQPVTGTEDGRYKLCGHHYYKYRAANFMFGFNAGIMRKMNRPVPARACARARPRLSPLVPVPARACPCVCAPACACAPSSALPTYRLYHPLPPCPTAAPHVS